MNRKTILIFLSCHLLLFLSCKKDIVNQNTIEKNTSHTGKNKEIKQKIIVAEPNVIKSSILSLKYYTQATANTSFKTASQIVPIDSALWLLEAALNYDFNQMTNNSTYSDSTSVSIQLSDTTNITLTDLTIAYSSLFNYISQKTQQNKLIKIIDIYSYLNETNNLTISANIILCENNSGNKTENVCDPYSGIRARWSLPLTNTPPFFYCTNYTTNNDGPTLCNNKLNCYQFNPPCYPYYYTNVITLNFDNVNNNFSNALFYDLYGTGSPQNVCLPPELMDFQLNNYINGCRNLGISNIPTNPPGYVITNYSVSATFYILPPSPGGGGYTKLWWKLDVTYGIPICYPNG